MCTKRFQVMDFLFCLLNENKFSKGDRLVSQDPETQTRTFPKPPFHLLPMDGQGPPCVTPATEGLVPDKRVREKREILTNKSVGKAM